MKQTINIRRLSFVTLFIILPILGLPLEASPLEKPLFFQQFTQKEGLSSEMVYAIASKGEEIWFGTYGGGATRYDKAKKSWKAYTTKGEPMEKVDDGDSIKWKNLLPYNHVSVILADEGGNRLVISVLSIVPETDPE